MELRGPALNSVFSALHSFPRTCLAFLEERTKRAQPLFVVTKCSESPALHERLWSCHLWLTWVTARLSVQNGTEARAGALCTFLSAICWYGTETLINKPDQGPERCFYAESPDVTFAGSCFTLVIMIHFSHIFNFSFL